MPGEIPVVAWEIGMLIVVAVAVVGARWKLAAYCITIDFLLLNFNFPVANSDKRSLDSTLSRTWRLKFNEAEASILLISSNSNLIGFNWSKSHKSLKNLFNIYIGGQVPNKYGFFLDSIVKAAAINIILSRFKMRPDCFKINLFFFIVTEIRVAVSWWDANYLFKFMEIWQNKSKF